MVKRTSELAVKKREKKENNGNGNKTVEPTGKQQKNLFEQAVK